MNTCDSLKATFLNCQSDIVDKRQLKACISSRILFWCKNIWNIPWDFPKLTTPIYLKNGYCRMGRINTRIGPYPEQKLNGRCKELYLGTLPRLR